MKQTLRYVALGALFLIPFLPLYVANTLFFPFITGKGFMFRILVEIAAVAYLALALLDTKYRPRFSWVLALYAALVGWMFIADLFAINAHKAFWSNFERMDGFVTLIHVFLFFVVAGALLTADKLWKNWWLTFIGASALVCGYSLLQLSGAVQINQGGVRVDATMGNAAYLAAYLLFALAATMWQAFETKKGWLRHSLFALGALQLIILFYTATRGAILGVMGAMVLCAFLFALESGGKARRLAAGVLVALLLVAGGFYLARDSAWVKAEPTLARISSITLAEGQTRFTLWGMAAEGVKERPLTGYGHEGFNYIFNTYYEPSLFKQEPWFDRAHSVFVDWLVSGGVPAFLLFILLLGAAVYELYRAKVSRPERILLTGALAAYAFQALFVFDNLFTYIPLAAVLATIHAASSRSIKKLEALPEVSQAQGTSLVAPVALVAAIVIVWMVNIPNMNAANHLVYAISPLPGGPSQNLVYFQNALDDHSFATQEIAEQLVTYTVGVANNESIPSKVKEEVSSLAIEQVAKEVEHAPQDARLRLQYSLAYRVAGKYDRALEQVDEAIALSPKKQAFHIERGMILIDAKRYKEARDSFRTAFELDTRFTDIAAQVAAGEILAGDTAAGKALLMSQFGTTTVDSQALVRAYYETKQYDDLIAVLKTQVVVNDRSPESRLRLLSGYALAGRFVEARAEGQSLIKDVPSSASQVQAILAGFPQT